jgi:hypothetical protein
VQLVQLGHKAMLVRQVIQEVQVLRDRLVILGPLDSKEFRVRKGLLGSKVCKDCKVPLEVRDQAAMLAQLVQLVNKVQPVLQDRRVVLVQRGLLVPRDLKDFRVRQDYKDQRVFKAHRVPLVPKEILVSLYYTV